MPSSTLGLNEALILASLTAADDVPITAIAERIAAQHVREIDDGTIYMALRRMEERGFVRSRKAPVVSETDHRTRQIGFYSITGSGQRVLADFDRAAGAIRKLRLVLQG